MKLTSLFIDFFNSEKLAGFILIFCTAFSLFIANSAVGPSYIHLWHLDVFSKPIEFWINDGLMTIFFLLVGLEIEREFYIGELSSIKKSMLPILAAVGGMIIPASIHFAFNNGTASQNGFGIPMATDIAFSLGILSLLGKRIPASLKVFLTALAIIDDLGAILVISLFYSEHLSLMYLGFAALLFLFMLVLNRVRFYKVWIYLIIGCVMWFCMYHSGIHPTITGVLLAFAIPFGNGSKSSPSYHLQYYLHKPVAFLILPIFALTNTAIVLHFSTIGEFLTPNSLGIILGLVIGKPLGIFFFSIAGAALGFCVIPRDIKKSHLLGVGALAGIGFTMSIFTAMLAFKETPIIEISKIAVITASILAGIIGYLGLRLTLTKQKI